MVSPFSSLVEGAVDFYVHASPDPIPRLFHDVALAETLKGAALAAAVHRHHSASTVERSALVREVTGFALWGAVEFSGPAGGLDPTLAEVGLHQGAVLVCLPMLSGSGWRALEIETPIEFGDVPVVGDDGSLLPEIGEIVALVGAAGATLVTGYLLPREQEAVIRLAVAQGLDKIVLTNPIGRGFSMSADAVLELAQLGPVMVELSVHQIEEHMDEAAALIGRLSPERVILSSDAGTVAAAPPHELLAWGCGQLLERSVTEADVRRMVQTNPAQLLIS